MRVQHLLHTSLLVFYFTVLSAGARSFESLGNIARLTTINEESRGKIVLTEWTLLTPDAILPSQSKAVSSTAVPASTSAGTKLTLLEFSPQMSKADLTIVWQQSSSSRVQVKIFDVAGQLALVTELGEYPAGEHEIQTDLSNLMPGIYSYELHAGEVMVERPLVIIR